MNVNEVGRRLVDFCRQGRDHDALDLYSPNAVSVEAASMPEMPQVMTGVDSIRRKSEWWTRNNEVHDAKVKGSFPNGDKFAGLHGRGRQEIVREEFFYPTT